MTKEERETALTLVNSAKAALRQRLAAKESKPQRRTTGMSPALIIAIVLTPALGVIQALTTNAKDRKALKAILLQIFKAIRVAYAADPDFK